MINALLILLLILAYTMQSFLCKVYSDSYPGEESMTSPIFSIVSGFVTAAATFCLTGFLFAPEPRTILFGLLNAAVLAGYNICFISGSQKGDYSVLMTSVIAGGILIPTVVAAVFFDEKPGLWKYLSLLLVLVSAYLIMKKKEEAPADGEPTAKKKNSPLFYAVCLLLAVCNGVYGTFLDVQQRVTGVEDKEEMVILTYLFMAVGMAVYAMIRRRKQLIRDFRQTKKSALFLILCSLTVAAAVNLLTFLIRYIDNIAMLYTFDNAGTMFFSAICSVVFLKEKLSVGNVIGIILMCAGLVLVTIF